MLKCQYAARYLFNYAEVVNVAVWLFAILSAIMVFVDLDSSVSLWIPIAIDVFSLAALGWRNYNVKWAAKLRNYFDAVVLGIGLSNYSEADKRSIFERISNIERRKSDTLRIQINNTGRDNPPGVKNWYEFPDELSGCEAVFETQKQNCWWNKRLSSRRKVIVGIVLVSIFISALFVMTFHQQLSDKIIACFVALAVNAFDLIQANIKYDNLSKAMDTLIKTPDISKNASQLEYLQRIINDRRQIPVLEMNLIHKKHSKEWSETYGHVSKNSNSNFPPA